jgi:hypothetical protein
MTMALDTAAIQANVIHVSRGCGARLKAAEQAERTAA